MAVQWGSVAQWASAILTSGSLALAFYILLKDRRKSEREQASRVSAAYDREAKSVRIFNRSDQAVYNVFVFPYTTLHYALPSAKPGIGWEKIGWVERQGNIGSVGPHSETSYTPPAGSFDGAEPTRVDILFVDSFGRSWARSGAGLLVGGSNEVKTLQRLGREGRLSSLDRLRLFRDRAYGRIGLGRLARRT